MRSNLVDYGRCAAHLGGLFACELRYCVVSHFRFDQLDLYMKIKLRLVVTTNNFYYHEKIMQHRCFPDHTSGAVDYSCIIIHTYCFKIGLLSVSNNPNHFQLAIPPFDGLYCASMEFR
jgi:hypothetical protein